MLSVKLTFVSPPSSSLSLTPSVFLLCASSPFSSSLCSHPLFFYCLLLSLSLAPSTQMLPAAQLDRSDGMCQLGITPVPTSYTASKDSGLGGCGGSRILESLLYLLAGESWQETCRDMEDAAFPSWTWIGHEIIIFYFCLVCCVNTAENVFLV